jgi:diacylglycerol kinase (ATP)
LTAAIQSPSSLDPVRVALVVNRASGRGLDPAPLARAMEAHGAQVTLHEYDAPDVEPASPERIVVAGGDGTIGPVSELAGRLGVPLGVIPAGTGTRLRRFELGRLGDGRPFVNVASAGLASVAAHRAAPLKPRLGPLAYAVGAVRAAATAGPLPCTVRADGETVFEGEAWQVILAVTGAFGGGSGVAVADPSDGALDAAILPAGSRIGLARRAWGMKRHTIAEQRGVEHHRGAVIELDVPPGTEVNADGEVRTTGLERVTAEHDAYALVVP